MRYVAKKKPGEEILEDLGQILKQKLKDTTLKDLVEYGFYGSAGILTYIALGKVKAPPRTPPTNSRELYAYGISEWRGAIVDVVRIGSDLTNKSVLGFKPFFFIGAPLEGFRQIIDKKTADGKYYLRVPPPLREIVALGLPSLMYTTKELMEGTVEVG